MTGKLRPFRRRRLSPEEGKALAQRVFFTPIEERLEKATELHLDDPETLLSMLGVLPKQWETAPVETLAEASFLYGYLEKLRVQHPIDPILHDEREYFLGEAARIAGVACRFLSHRTEARRWLDLAESWFLATEGSSANVARVTYQRLALRMEEREFEAVLELAPHLVANFDRMGMPEDSLKAQFLCAVIQKETQRFEEALEAFLKILESAEALGNDVLRGTACVNVTQIYSFLGDAENAMLWADRATPILHNVGNNIGLAQLQWGVGYLLRSQKKTSDAIAAYRGAQKAFAAIGMHADVAAVHLVVADLLLDVDQAAQAEWEIRSAFPIIEEYKLVPEGIAALSLLRESVRNRQIDRQALRALHGYFEKVSR